MNAPQSVSYASQAIGLFWAKVAIRGPSDCWEWRAGKNRCGYGCYNVRVEPGDNGREHWLSHRFSWQVSRHPIPPGMQVLHRCDNPGCVNPQHLFLGDHAANMVDKVAKGRQRRLRGTSNGSSKLTNSDVVAIRVARASGRTLVDIAVEFGVSKSLVSVVARGEAWGHVQWTALIFFVPGQPVPQPRPRPSRNGGMKPHPKHKAWRRAVKAAAAFAMENEGCTPWPKGVPLARDHDLLRPASQRRPGQRVQVSGGCAQRDGLLRRRGYQRNQRAPLPDEEPHQARCVWCALRRSRWSRCRRDWS